MCARAPCVCCVSMCVWCVCRVCVRARGMCVCVYDLKEFLWWGRKNGKQQNVQFFLQADLLSLSAVNLLKSRE